MLVTVFTQHVGTDDEALEQKTTTLSGKKSVTTTDTP